jgi:hypothetical protein
MVVVHTLSGIDLKREELDCGIRRTKYGKVRVVVDFSMLIKLKDSLLICVCSSRCRRFYNILFIPRRH